MQISPNPNTPSSPAAPARPRIVLAEDDGELRRIIADKFRAAGIDVVEIETGTRLADFLIVRNGIDTVDAIVSDIRMPGLSGLDMLAYLSVRGCTTPTILISGFGDWTIRREAQSFGAVTVFDKPVDVDDLVQFVRQFVSLPRDPTAASAKP
jgi:two-component system C4-dicarboxylate transport response regulator DctD